MKEAIRYFGRVTNGYVFNSNNVSGKGRRIVVSPNGNIRPIMFSGLTNKGTKITHQGYNIDDISITVVLVQDTMPVPTAHYIKKVDDRISDMKSSPLTPKEFNNIVKKVIEVYDSQIWDDIRNWLTFKTRDTESFVIPETVIMPKDYVATTSRLMSATNIANKYNIPINISIDDILWSPKNAFKDMPIPLTEKEATVKGEWYFVKRETTVKVEKSHFDSIEDAINEFPEDGMVLVRITKNSAKSLVFKVFTMPIMLI